MKQMMTLVRRELIEHRAGWAVPAVFGALFVVASVLAVFGLVRVGVLDDPMTLAEISERVDAGVMEDILTVLLVAIAVVLNLVMASVVVFYLLDALYAERKDRSILFWKSLPVSDLQVVGSKYLTAAIAIPVLTAFVFVVTAILVTLIGGVGLMRAGGVGVIAMSPGAIMHATAFLLYSMVVQALWFAPVAGWLLLVSAFAKRAVLGWAILPPVLVVVAERTLLGSRHVLDLIGYRLTGGFELAFSTASGRIIVHDDTVMSGLPHLADLLTPGRLLAAPSLWLGIAVGVVLLAGAVWLRRWRDEA